jgi:SAM-dependent methyltransferase
MGKEASWRGSATATPRQDFLRILGILRPTKRDVFFDLGCGYGRLCILAAPRVSLSVGIENHYYRYLRAKRAVEQSQLSNVQIKYGDFYNFSFRSASILYSIVDAGFATWAKIDRQCKKGTIIVQYGMLPYPIKAKHMFGNYFITRTPLIRVRDTAEYCRIYMKSNTASIDKLRKSLGKEGEKQLLFEIRNSESNWRNLMRQRKK